MIIWKLTLICLTCAAIVEQDMRRKITLIYLKRAVMVDQDSMKRDQGRTAQVVRKLTVYKPQKAETKSYVKRVDKRTRKSYSTARDFIFLFFEPTVLSKC